MTTEAMEAYCDAMALVADRRADGWITDREPEEDGEYLVTWGYRSHRRLMTGEWLAGQWFSPTGYELEDAAGKVIAWQPLPEPYVPGGEE